MTDTDALIADCLAKRLSFILDAGAGSGKTTSLVNALQRAVDILGVEMGRRGQRIACITYTNVAKDEIVERIKGSLLVRVSTIHDFLWSILSGHQRTLKRAVAKLNAQLAADSSRRRDPEQLANALPMVAITYSDTGSNFLEGRLFHDDLLGVAKIMFADSPQLSQIVVSQFPYILVDEYQDASPDIIELLLGRIVNGNEGRVVVGLFGDKMQHIYDSGVGEIPAPQLARLVQIVKEDNYRCSLAVIGLLNRLRADIQQTPGRLNSKVPGDAIYIRATAPDADVMERVRKFVRQTPGWEGNPTTERELYLTHRLISKKGGYDRVLSAFDQRGGFYRDRLLTGEDPCIAFFLKHVEPLASAWEAGHAGAALSKLRAAGFTLSTEKTKQSTRASLDILLNLRKTGTVGEVLRHVLSAGLLALPDDFFDRLNGRTPTVADSDKAREREERDKIFFATLYGLQYSEISSFAAFFEAHTPYSTQHGVKGAQFDTVYVVLDDKGARWNMYSFEKFLSGEDQIKNERRFIKTRNILYVCCSRAMRNLAVVDLGAASPKKDAAIRALFGEAKCFEV